MPQHNSNILALLNAGPFSMEWNFAVESMATYQEEMDALKAGAPYASLGISEKRARSFPGVIYSGDSGRPIIMRDSKLLNDESKTPKGAFAHLRLQGVMRSQDGASSRGVNSLVDDMNAAISNDKIEGILLEINTGGGQALAGQILHTAIANSPKAVVSFGHMVASAGYMAAMGSDEIIASSAAAQFGSIGTMITLPTGWYANFYNKYYQDHYASKSINKNKSFREFLNGDLSGMKEYLESVNEQFLDAVKNSRTLKGNDQRVSHTLSGAMFNAKEAKSRGLIDGVGGLGYALKRLTAAAIRRKQTT